MGYTAITRLEFTIENFNKSCINGMPARHDLATCKFTLKFSKEMYKDYVSQFFIISDEEAFNTVWDSATHDFLSNGGVVLTENQRTLQALEAKLDFLVEPKSSDYRDHYHAYVNTGRVGDIESVWDADEATYSEAYNKYHTDKEALTTAIRHYKELIQIEHALTLIA